METLLIITAIFALIAFIVLSIIAVKSIVNAMKMIDQTSAAIAKITTDFGDFKTRAVQTLDEFTELKHEISNSLLEVQNLSIKAVSSLEHFDSMSIQAEKSIDRIEKRVDSVFHIFEPVSMIIQNMFERVSAPFDKTFSAAGKAISVFSTFFKSKKQHDY